MSHKPYVNGYLPPIRSRIGISRLMITFLLRFLVFPHLRRKFSRILTVFRKIEMKNRSVTLDKLRLRADFYSLPIDSAQA